MVVKDVFNGFHYTQTYTFWEKTKHAGTDEASE